MELMAKVTLDPEYITTVLVKSGAFDILWKGRPEAYDGLTSAITRKPVLAIIACRRAVMALCGKSAGLKFTKNAFEKHYDDDGIHESFKESLRTQHPKVVTWADKEGE